MGHFETILWYLYLAATAGVLAQLVRLRICATYRYLSFYLIAQLTVGLIMLPLSIQTNFYAYVYLIGQVAGLILGSGAVLEIYRLAFIGRPGLAAFGQRAVIYLLLASTAIAIVSLLLDADLRPGQSLILHRFFALERSVELVLVLCLLVASVFLLWFPVKVSRNTVVYVAGFVVYYLARSAGLLLTNVLSPAAVRPLSTAMMAVTLLCMLGWMAWLRAEEDDAVTVTGHRWNPSAAENLTAQLDAINAALTRHGRH
jgi:hypothetical protein